MPTEPILLAEVQTNRDAVYAVLLLATTLVDYDDIQQEWCIHKANIEVFCSNSFHCQMFTMHPKKPIYRYWTHTCQTTHPRWICSLLYTVNTWYLQVPSVPFHIWLWAAVNLEWVALSPNDQESINTSDANNYVIVISSQGCGRFAHWYQDSPTLMCKTTPQGGI